MDRSWANLSEARKLRFLLGKERGTSGTALVSLGDKGGNLKSSWRRAISRWDQFVLLWGQNVVGDINCSLYKTCRSMQSFAPPLPFSRMSPN
ncbi:hypothetical protein RND71_015497 [Anisodus tanguticus]|uniref:Uncharacterized protein n=1 Tax=Anisodus tanguticus TaxID=243964 RepID=A0AAE1S4E6_9SOLA|nr:hypothetical protein RND71_015497 [Anisodus tanguticus]